MATTEQLAEQVRQLMQETRVLSDQVQAVEADNRRLRDQTEGIAAIPELVEAIKGIVARPGSSNKLVDTKGIGKPSSFSGDDGKYREWAAKFESFVSSVFGDSFRKVMDWAIEQGEPIEEVNWLAAFGPASEVLRTASGRAMGWRCGGSWRGCTTQRRAAASATSCARSSILAALAWRSWARRWSAGRSSWPGTSAGRTRMARKTRMAREMRTAALESLLPKELDEHVLLNQSRLQAGD